MRTKGSVSSVSISLATLNKVLKPNASVMVSKKFADAVLMLANESIQLNDELGSDSEEKEIPILVETY